jgi:hypothetical protein
MDMTRQAILFVCTGEIYLFLLNFTNQKILLNHTIMTYYSVYQLHISPEVLR